jgi:DNA primase
LIKKESIESINDSINIVDVVSGYIELKKAGASYKARCPFHEEKSPSFSVSESKQMFYCFGCQVGGSSITFVKKIEDINFVEAVELLSERFGVPLEYEKNSNRTFEKLPVLQTLNNWFEKNLFSNQFAYNYLIDRGLTKSTIKNFKLGYSPKSYELLQFLEKNNIHFDDALHLGVIALNENGTYYSRFNERVMFPIFSQNGKIIAFGGRTLGNHPAKYINSPTTSVFNKSKTLYGFNFARRQIDKLSEVIIVEGYLDVIMLHQAGFENAIAPLGTALTREHMHILKRGNIVFHLAFDGDRAGLEATKKALDLLIPIGIESKVTIFDKGIDPADLIKDGNIDKVKDIFANSADSIKFYLERIVSKYNLNNPYDKNQAFKDVKEFIAKIPKVVGKEYSGFISNLLALSSPELLFTNKKIGRLQHSRGTDDIIGFAEKSIIRTAMDNHIFVDKIVEELNEQDFTYYKHHFKIIQNKDFNNPDLIPISMSECNIFSAEELETQLIHLKMKNISMKLRTRGLSFSEGRNLKNNLVSLRKKIVALT